MKCIVPQTAHSMTPAIPVESAIPSAPTPASKDVSKCTSEGETSQEGRAISAALREKVLLRDIHDFLEEENGEPT